MQRRRIGSLQVSAVGIGCNNFGWRIDAEQTARVVDAALGAGIDFFDTADLYGKGLSEEFLGRALGPRRASVIIATKFHAPMGDDPNQRGNSRRWIVHEVENSLRRLKTDYIDLYQVHRPDPQCDIDETLGALTDLVRQGKVRYIGSSTFPAEEIVEAQWVAERRGRERFVTEQPPYSILARGIEAAVLPTCERYGMGVIPWSPLAGGWLTGRYRRGSDLPTTGRAARTPGRFDPSIPANQRKLDLVEELLKVAADAGCSLTHMAHAFVLSHPAVSAAIIGPRTMEQLEDALAGADVTLDDDVLDRIDTLVPPGTTVNADDSGYVPPSLQQSWRRRRPSNTRGA